MEIRITNSYALQVCKDEDPNEAYFKQDNEDYINYWNTHDTAINNGTGQVRLSAPTDDWGALQRDWDAFEATTTGVKPVANYQFQPRNPYLHRDASMTRTHAMHLNGAQSFYEVWMFNMNLFFELPPDRFTECAGVGS